MKILRDDKSTSLQVDQTDSGALSQEEKFNW